MNFVILWEIFRNIGSAVGILITLSTFWGLISKKPKNALEKIIERGAKKANQQTEEDLQKVLVRLDANDEATVVSLRHSITNIYERYKNEKKFPTHVKEDLFSLFEQYEKLGGNHYVKQIVEEMKGWEVE